MLLPSAIRRSIPLDSCDGQSLLFWSAVTSEGKVRSDGEVVSRHVDVGRNQLRQHGYGCATAVRAADWVAVVNTGKVGIVALSLVTGQLSATSLPLEVREATLSTTSIEQLGEGFAAASAALRTAVDDAHLARLQWPDGGASPASGPVPYSAVEGLKYASRLKLDGGSGDSGRGVSQPFLGRVAELHRQHIDYARRGKTSASPAPPPAPTLPHLGLTIGTRSDLYLLPGARTALFVMSRDALVGRNNDGAATLYMTAVAEFHAWVSRLFMSGFFDGAATAADTAVDDDADAVVSSPAVIVLVNHPVIGRSYFEWLLHVSDPKVRAGRGLTIVELPSETPVGVWRPYTVPVTQFEVIEPCAHHFNSVFLRPALLDAVRQEGTRFAFGDRMVAPSADTGDPPSSDEYRTWLRSMPRLLFVRGLPADGLHGAHVHGTDDATTSLAEEAGYTVVDNKTPLHHVALLASRAEAILCPWRFVPVIARFAVASQRRTQPRLIALSPHNTLIGDVEKSIVGPAVRWLRGGLSATVTNASKAALGVCIKVIASAASEPYAHAALRLGSGMLQLSDAECALEAPVASPGEPFTKRSVDGPFTWTKEWSWLAKHWAGLDQCVV